MQNEESLPEKRLIAWYLLENNQQNDTVNIKCLRRMSNKSRIEPKPSGEVSTDKELDAINRPLRTSYFDSIKPITSRHKKTRKTIENNADNKRPNANETETIKEVISCKEVLIAPHTHQRAMYW